MQSSHQELESLYRDHAWHVYRRSLRILGNEEDARDVCQDVFVRLLAAGGTPRQATSARAWVYRVTTNLCIDRLRVRKHHDPAAVAQLATTDDPERRVVDRQLLTRLLGRLSRSDQQLVILRYLDGCTLEELEQISGHTRKTISKRLNRIRSRAEKLARRHRGPR